MAITSQQSNSKFIAKLTQNSNCYCLLLKQRPDSIDLTHKELKDNYNSLLLTISLVFKCSKSLEVMSSWLLTVRKIGGDIA